MKNIIIIIAILIASGYLFAQNIIDPPKVSNSFTDTNVFDRNFGENNFILGWNYGGTGKELDDALSINYYLRPYFEWDDQNDLADIDSFAVAHRQLLHISDLSNPASGDRPFNAQSIRLDPTIEVCTTNAFVPRPYDNSGAVFGFHYKNKVRILGESDHNDPNYYHAMLDKDSVGAIPVKVLDSLWDGRWLRYLNYDDTKQELDNPYNGKQWYLTINLKNLDEDLDDYLNSTVLSLKVRYTMDDNSTGYIKFDDTASSALADLADVDTLFNQDRGRFKTLVSAGTPKPTEFNITGEMIRVHTTNFLDSSITLSAYFVCDGQSINNPFLEYTDSDNAEDEEIEEYIKHFDIEVYYHGNVDIGIRYIRLETPRAQEVFRGNFDHIVRDTIFNEDELFDKLDGNASGVRIHRIYGNDEMTPKFWGAMRYYNMLCDTLVNIETFTWQKAGIYAGLHMNLPLQYLHATAFKEFFCGSTIDLNTWHSVPYVDYGKRTNDYEISYPEFFNLKAGRRGYYQNDTLYTFSDSLNSNYETWLSGDSTRTIPYDSMEVYDHFSHVSNSFQGTQNRIEFQLYQSYYKYQPLLYNSKPWIPFLWITPYGIIDPEINSFTFHQYNCSATGELTRLKMYSPLILGCKGLCYWFKVERPHLDFSGDGRYIGLLSNVHDIPEITQNFTLDSLIYYDGIGGDYIKLQDDPNNIDDVFDDTKYRFDTLGIYTNHVYIGLKSARAEINKVHKWIDAVEDDLLNLRLQAWYGKGFTELYSQHPDCSSDFLHDFIEYDSIRTKRIWNAEEGIYQSTYEDFDSSFFDVTLLKHIDNNDMDSVFFIGALNRRTDPLIYDQIGDGNDSTLKFFSTAEYDLGVASGYPTWWKDRWWRRLGCRRIKIPFNYRYSNDADEYTVLRIKELGVDNQNFDLDYFRDPDLNHLIDTTISADGSLVVNMLPGQGKIFKVEVSYSPKFSGYLNHSNQRNMVIYPTDNESLTWKDEIDDVRYHSVYFKEIPKSNPERFGVYYRRSEIMDGTFPDEAIDWEATEHLLSGTLDFDCVEDGLTTTDNNCKYPAIVVRYDSIAQVSKVYAVYVCSCFDDCKECDDTTHAYVVENIFNANNTTIIVGTGKVIAKVNTFNYDQIDKWGTPMVNASRNGNYYCWSDSLFGIVAGFKGADKSCFSSSSDTIHVYADSLSQNELPYAMMPSLNSYSRIRMYSDTTCGEDDCAMVWMESPPDYPNLDSSEIYYTRLKLDDNGDLINYLPKTLCYLCTLQAEYNYDSTCICISSYPDRSQSSNNGAPVIYRGNAVYDIPTPEDETDPLLSSHHDMVYWQGTDDIWNDDCIFYTTINMLDTIDTDNNTWKPDCWGTLGRFSILSFSKSLYSPTASQGNMTKRNDQSIGDYYSWYTDSLITLDFAAYESGVPSNIWEVNHSYHTLYPNWGTLLGHFEDYIYSRKIEGEGYCPNLAALPFIIDDTHWSLNRRLFNTGNSVPPEIVSSHILFYRNVDTEDFSCPFFGFADGNDECIISPIILVDKYGNTEIPKMNLFEEEDGRYYPADTIKTDWFKVENLKKMLFYCNGTDDSLFDMYVERQSDGKQKRVPISFVDDTTFSAYKCSMINGSNNEYRIIFIKKNDDVRYHEKLIIDGLPSFEDYDNDVDNDSFQRSALEGQSEIIDLGSSENEINNSRVIQLSLFPNPADETLYVTAYMPVSAYTETKKERTNTLSLSIYSLLGERLYQAHIKPGETIKVDVDTYPIGTYIIRAEEVIHSTALEPVSPGIERFVIER